MEGFWAVWRTLQPGEQVLLSAFREQDEDTAKAYADEHNRADGRGYSNVYAQFLTFDEAQRDCDRTVPESHREPLSPAETGMGDLRLGAFQIEVEKLLCDLLGRSWAPTGFSIATLVEDIRDRLSTPTEPQAAPAQGNGVREASDDVIERACEAYADATGYYVKFHRGLSSTSADDIRKGMRAALATLQPSMGVERPSPQQGEAADNEIHSSDGPGVRQEDSALSHGESLQQGADTSSKPSTAVYPHGKGSDAAYVAKPPAASDRASHAATGPSEALSASPHDVRGEWHEGAPPKPYSEEWFIAETTFGDRVVLKALPEEYSYDFKTADETYIKRDKIKRWMQFPDSDYISLTPRRRVWRCGAGNPNGH